MCPVHGEQPAVRRLQDNVVGNRVTMDALTQHHPDVTGTGDVTGTLAGVPGSLGDVTDSAADVTALWAGVGGASW